jgi:amidohydrolase
MLTLPDLRRALHRIAEPSNEERETSTLLEEELRATQPDELATQVGGHGILAVYYGHEPGSTVMLRCDMDAVPVADDESLVHAAKRKGVGHKCGHDGHMSILIAVARKLGGERPKRGKVALLFQPAEETGEGAARVIEDDRFRALAPDRVVALHNLPGRPLGQVVLRDGSFSSASKGMTVELLGVSAHAAEPHLGVSPVAAAAAIAQTFQAAPQRSTALHDCAQVTVVGMNVGGPAFGTSPGSGRVMATLRAHNAEGMRAIQENCVRSARGLAAAHGLECRISWTDDFPATINDPNLVDAIRRSALELELDVHEIEHPHAWSEDFGHFTSKASGALFGLGSGESQPSLHHPDYDFPDELIEIGAGLFMACLPRLL